MAGFDEPVLELVLVAGRRDRSSDRAEKPNVERADAHLALERLPGSRAMLGLRKLVLGAVKELLEGLAYSQVDDQL